MVKLDFSLLGKGVVAMGHAEVVDPTPTVRWIWVVHGFLYFGKE